MINPAPYLRQTIFSLLNGNVTYNGDVIPVYETEGKESDSIQIIIADYSDANAGNKQKFGSRARQVLEVVSEQPKATKKTVDEVGNLITAIIQSDPQAADTLSGSTFDINILGKPSINHIVENSGSASKLVRLILSYDLLIVQK
jgi:hypothetical protein